MAIRAFLMGIVAGFFVMGCAGATFAWKYYGMQMATYDGKLLGPTPADDKDISTCQGNNCVVMYSRDFYAVKQDWLQCHTDLDACQRRCP